MLTPNMDTYSEIGSLIFTGAVCGSMVGFYGSVICDLDTTMILTETLAYTYVGGMIGAACELSNNDEE